MKSWITMFLSFFAITLLFAWKKDNPPGPGSNDLGQNHQTYTIKNGGFTFQGHKRTYMLALPENYSGNKKAPLVIYLHSYGWTADQDMVYTSLYKAAYTSGVIVAYPNGIPNWNSGIGDDPNLETPNVDDAAFIKAMIDNLNTHYSIDLKRVYACGYSNGGFMAYKLACQLSKRIAAIASVGGVMSKSTAENCKPVHPMPVLQIHGTADEWVPINGNAYWQSVDKTLTYWINFNKCTNKDTTFLPNINKKDKCKAVKYSYKNSTNGCEVIYYKVTDGGHTWPGAGVPTFTNPGNANADFDANVAILNFFKKYKLN